MNASAAVTTRVTFTNVGAPDSGGYGFMICASGSSVGTPMQCSSPAVNTTGGQASLEYTSDDATLDVHAAQAVDTEPFRVTVGDGV
jgi:hypothetical protein